MQSTFRAGSSSSSSSVPAKDELLPAHTHKSMHFYCHAHPSHIPSTPTTKPPLPPSSFSHLSDTTLDNRRRAILILNRAAAGPAGLDALDDADGGGVAVGHLAEDDVAAVEPGGDDGGDEELGAVGVGPRVGHAEEEGLVVGELEVLVGELLAVDGFAARALKS